ncbi:MAG: hypothetical protein K2L96_01415 [Muribaculaceae bacterium]|nr:hypothetical protein [Muribaculaceae bacterium]
MGKFLLLGLGLLLPLAVYASTPEQDAAARALREQRAPLAFRQTAKAKPLFEDEKQASGRNRVVSATPSLSFEGKNEIGYLDGPDGSTWFYTMTFDKEEIQHEYYKESHIKGFEVSVYDSARKLVGTVKDMIDFEEDDVAVAAVSIDPMVSKLFFNGDNYYEIVVNMAMNRPNYEMRYFAQVYSLGAAADADGDSKVVQTLPGYICASVNTAKYAWEEIFYVAILTETGYDDSKESLAEYIDSNKQVVTVYKRASWNGGPSAIGTLEVAYPNLPGDQMAVPFFMADVRDGQPLFVFQHYDKWFFNNAVGPGYTFDDSSEGDGMPTENNKLVVESYTYSGWGSELQPLKRVEIPVDQTTDNSDVMFRYYSIGHLLYGDDIDAEGNTNVCIQQYLRSNDDAYLYEFARYDAAGNRLHDIAKDVEYFVFMSDVRGFDPQIMYAQSDETGAFTFHFVNIPSGEEITSFPAAYQNYSLRTNVDRYPVGDSYEYAFQTMQSAYDEDMNVLEQIVWINADGDYSHTDVVNLGGDVNMAQVYISGPALSPYIFNSDESREYMWLVKRRRDGSSSSATDTWLYVLSSDGTKLFEVGPDAEKGIITNVSLLSPDKSPALWINFMADDYGVSSDFYSLPFAKFEKGGDGSKENPYLISTVGDFALLRAYPDKHFALACDIVADGVELSGGNLTFYGSLDGRGHSVTGLCLTGGGIFSALQAGAEVKDITFIGSRIIDLSGTYAGFISSNASGAKLSGVHVIDLRVADNDSDISFGGLVGSAVLGTTIENCSLQSSTISMAKSTMMGGIAATLRTGASVTACSVKATLSAESQLGGIVGEMSADTPVSDCHVDAHLTASNTIGGIAGFNEGAAISRCYVEGTIKATGEKRLAYTDFGPCAGGIVGWLQHAYTTDESGEATMRTQPVVLNNFVALSEITGYTPDLAPRYSSQQQTIHRVIGRSQVNETPMDVEYDENYQPVYGELLPAELRLDKNYCSSDLAVVLPEVEALHNTTEGESVDRDRLSAEWFAENLGLEYGEGKNWNELADNDPALMHENGNFCTPSEITVEQGELFDVYVVFVGVKTPDITEIFDQLYYSSSNEDVAEMTGDATITKGRLAVKFEAKQVGETNLDICGAKCKVTVVPGTSGIDSVVADSATLGLAYDGENVVAAGAAIGIYNLSGTCVLAGNESVSVRALVPGVYVAKATSSEASATLKFAKN